ncbi:MAG: glycosyl hydrolase 115 family protein [Acidobacteriales bacterium]|nr:glycosyl hydrolase 115 family protein [Terriglobales bacterium]
MRRFAFFICLLFTTAAHAQVAIDAGTAVLIDPGEPGPIQKAARDLASDMQAVFGKPVRLTHDRAGASATTICVAFSRNRPRGVARPAGWEVLQMKVVANPWPGSPVRQAIVLTGSDIRGTIYAIYEFSRRFLKVDPFYWWTDHTPPQSGRVVLPANLGARDGSPTFRYRGWFMNDEDLMTAWRPGSHERSGISMATWDRVFEALLRSKGNMIIPNTFVFPYEPAVRAAADRGLVISQHHMEPLGLNVYQWPDDKPYTLDMLTAAWKCAVSQYPRDIEIVWTVGLRGRYDRPFWRDTPDVPTSREGKAKLIREAVDRQIAIVRNGWPHPNPKFIMNSWMEGSALMRDGLLKLPPEVTRVWADDGAGLLQDGGQISRGQGIYFHTGVIGGNANNFSERVPIERIHRELGRAARAGATEYMLLNPANIRPHVMSTRAVMDVAWNAGFSQPADWLTRWCREEFGEGAASAVERCYRAYHEAPARYGEREDETIADDFYHQLGRDLLVRIMRRDESMPVRFRFLKVSTYPGYTSRVVNMCRQAEPRWNEAARLAEEARPLVPVGRREFFQAHIATQVDLHRHSNLMLRDNAEAALPGASVLSQQVSVEAAEREARAVLDALRKAEYDKWAGFYTLGDWFVDIPLTLQLAEACLVQLRGERLSAAHQATLARAERLLKEDTSHVYIKIKAYQKGQKVQFCTGQ